MDWTPLAFWFAAALLAGLLVAALFWTPNDTSIGNAIGAFVILLGALFLFAREYIIVDRLRDACREAGVPCRISPADFMRYAIIGTIGFVDVAVLYLVSLRLEEARLRRAERRAALDL